MPKRVKRWIFLEIVFGLLSAGFYLINTITTSKGFSIIEFCLYLLMFVISTSANTLWDMYEIVKKKPLNDSILLVAIINIVVSAWFEGRFSLNYANDNNISKITCFIFTLTLVVCSVIIGWRSQWDLAKKG